MRRPTPQKQFPALIALMLLLSLVLLTLAPAAAAAAPHGGRLQRPGQAMPSGMPRIENGIITDGDGFIGNGVRGADRAPHRMRSSKPTAAAPTDMISVNMNGETGNMTPGLPEADGGTWDGQTPPLPTPRAGVASPDMGTDAGGSSILPWVIGIIVLLAAVLLVLAWMPRAGERSTSHKRTH